MSDEIRRYNLTIPAGTPQAAPAVFDLTMPPREVLHLDVRFPAGCNRAVGLWIGAAGTQVIPIEPGTWLIETGETLGYDLAHLHNSGSWEMVAYNTGAYPHTIGVTFAVDLPGDRTAPVLPIPLDALQPS